MPDKILISTFIRGNPEPQPRPRARAMPLGNGKFTAQSYNCERYGRDHEKHGQIMPWVVWREAIKRHIRSIMPKPVPADGAIVLRCQFFVERPGYLLLPKARCHPVPVTARHG
jgi:hypothetical protein